MRGFCRWIEVCFALAEGCSTFNDLRKEVQGHVCKKLELNRLRAAKESIYGRCKVKGVLPDAGITF